MEITFKVRDGRLIKHPISEFEKMEDCFLRNLILDCDHSKNEFIELNEDYDVITSIIESLRFNTLIFTENTNLKYMLALSEKWCMPEWMINGLYNEIYQNNIIKTISGFEETINNGFRKCIICGLGFHINNNKSNSCKSHKYGFSSSENLYTCCQSPNHNDYCLVGFHVADTTSILPYYREYMEVQKNNKKE